MQGLVSVILFGLWPPTYQYWGPRALSLTLTKGDSSVTHTMLKKHHLHEERLRRCARSFPVFGKSHGRCERFPRASVPVSSESQISIQDELEIDRLQERFRSFDVEGSVKLFCNKKRWFPQVPDCPASLFLCKEGPDEQRAVETAAGVS
jgi:hypothetical protein